MHISINCSWSSCVLAPYYHYHPLSVFTSREVTVRCTMLSAEHNSLWSHFFGRSLLAAVAAITTAAGLVLFGMLNTHGHLSHNHLNVINMIESALSASHLISPYYLQFTSFQHLCNNSIQFSWFTPMYTPVLLFIQNQWNLLQKQKTFKLPLNTEKS